MRLTLHEKEKCYRLVFAFRRDKVSDECYSMSLPKAESPAELAVILQSEATVLRQNIMRHIGRRCDGDATEGLSYLDTGLDLDED